GLSKSAIKSPPLPEGEGRGEGEGPAVLPQPPNQSEKQTVIFHSPHSKPTPFKTTFDGLAVAVENFTQTVAPPSNHPCSAASSASRDATFANRAPLRCTRVIGPALRLIFKM